MYRSLRHVWLSFAFAAGLAMSTGAAAGPADGLAGHYYLEGGPSEVGSELQLRENGTFEWALMYGAVDQGARGTWAKKDDRVVLTPARPEEPVFRVFGEGDYHKTKPVEPGRWIAIVGVPHVGPVAQVEVHFEARSGKTASAVSKPNGDAIVEMPASETWARAGLRRAGSTAPLQWFSIDAGRAQSRLVGFALTNVESLQQAPFATLVLRMESDGLVVDDADSGLRGTYARH